MRLIGFLAALLIPACLLMGVYLGGWYNFLALAFSFVMIPAIDQLTGLDTSNVSPQEEKHVSDVFYYRFITYLWTYLQVAMLFWAADVVASGRVQAAVEWIGFTLSCGVITGGVGITVAHELGHKKSKLEQLYSQVLLMTVCYMHFFIEHNRGHHVQVATEADPATARKGESFYRFWVRSVFEGYRHAWHLEGQSLERKGHAVFHWRNQMIWFTVLPLVFCGLLVLLFASSATAALSIVVFFFAQSVVAFTLLELVNYIEHYGILRRKLPSGEYERVNPMHSWNASHLISNFFLFQLQRHSDHHAYAHKRYQVLKHYDESPQLPYGYPTMILLALLPPVWFRFMHPRLEHWEKNVYQLSR